MWLQNLEMNISSKNYQLTIILVIDTSADYFSWLID